jgi:Cu/Ag efflux protein CusF
MKRIVLGVAIFGLLIAASPPASGYARLVTSSGRVVSVDTKENAMVVKFENSPGRTADIPFAVNRQTKVTRAGHRVRLAKIRTGDVVTVTFETVGGKNIAVNVGVEPKPAA